MNNEFGELIEYLNQKFSNIDQKFSNIDQKFSNIDERFTSIDNQLEDLRINKADKEDIENLLNSVDSYAQKADTYFQEMVMLSHKVDRHEKWIQQIADKLGVKLEH
jgi:hypothetical protein